MRFGSRGDFLHLELFRVPGMSFGYACGVPGSGFGVWGFRFRFEVSGSVPCCEIRDSGILFRVHTLELYVSLRGLKIGETMPDSTPKSPNSYHTPSISS